jgi:two-component system, LytTR family, response regulator
MKLRCLIIDDEFLARKYLRDYVSKLPALELVGDYNSPLKAMELIKSGEVDLLFLDIQMPDITGIEFLKTMDRAPYVVLTTAYEEYALQAYELNVADYLLKPFSFERFLKAVNKVQELAEKDKKLQLAKTETGDVMHKPQLKEDHLIIRADRKLYKINYEDLIYIEGQKAYVTFHTKKKNITALASLRDLEEQLPGSHFMRIHKSYIVSIHEIESLEGNQVEIGGTRLSVGKSYRPGVEKVFGLS